MDRRILLSLLAGLIIGMITALIYGHNTAERSKFAFDSKVECQELAEQYRARNSTETRTVFINKVGYSPSKTSCMAEITELDSRLGIDYTVKDLLSGETLFFAHPTADADPAKTTREQDANFASLTR